MTHYIGTTEIPTINNVSISGSVEETEIDIIDQSSNVVWESVTNAPQIEISFTLSEQAHTLGISVEEQRQRVKGLSDNPAEDNPFYFQNIQGFIYINDISVPETPANTIIEGSISGVILEWPKHFETESEPLGTQYGFGRVFGRYFGGNKDGEYVSFGDNSFGGGTYGG